MPIFGETSSPYDEMVEKVTADTMTSENWAMMIDICDKVSADGQRGSKQCLLSLRKRLNHRDPHVVLFALALLDCLWNNCGSTFRREISSKEFINELNYKATHSNRLIGEKTREILKKWSENECKKDASLSLVESLYKDLLNSGYNFEGDPSQKKKTAPVSNDPNVVTSEQEEADIAKAIALSLEGVKRSGNSRSQHKNSSYPALESNVTNVAAMNNQKQSLAKGGAGVASRRKVRALYDFEAVEDNELSFLVDDIITVIDDSDQNWWRGSTQRGVSGLFPASFVAVYNESNNKHGVHPNNGNGDDDDKLENQQQRKVEPPPVQINENILLKCIQLLEDCDPTSSHELDPPELAYFEQMSLAQAPLINHRLFTIDKQLDELAQVDLAIRDALANYDTVVRQL